MATVTIGEKDYDTSKFTEEQNNILGELTYCNKLVTQLKYQLSSLNATNDILFDKIKNSLEPKTELE
jgi:hypothetical protein|tara:strand:- start:3136 stop:3336 length:201 start_codon:yes stop_codon:yes gene_type:complete